MGETSKTPINNKIEKRYDFTIRYIGEFSLLKMIILNELFLEPSSESFYEVAKTCWVVEYKDLTEQQKDKFELFLKRINSEIIDWDIDEYEMVKGGE